MAAIHKTPLVVVTLEHDDELVEVEVQTDNRDMIAWDMHRNRVGWPSTQDAPVLWLTFIAWHALKRSASTVADLTFADMAFDRFQAITVAVGRPEADPEAEPEAVDPTRAGVEPA